jgi:hypothetical protein
MLCKYKKTTLVQAYKLTSGPIAKALVSLQNEGTPEIGQWYKL